MRVYSFVHRQEPETEGGEYDYVFILQNVGIGQLVNKLRRTRFELLYQYVIFEEEEETGEIIDKQNADEWFLDYLAWVRAKGFELGDLVASIYKRAPLYRIEKTFRTTVWLRPCGTDGEPGGKIQKGIPWGSFEKYR